MQEIIAIALLIGAILYLGYRAYRSYHKKNVATIIVGAHKLLG